ncbi:carbohydrate sulfotransferase 8 [Ciona intestinalis]
MLCRYRCNNKYMLLSLLVINVVYINYYVFVTQKTKGPTLETIKAKFESIEIENTKWLPEGPLSRYPGHGANKSQTLKERLEKRIQHLRDECKIVRNNKPLNFDKLGAFQYPWMYVNHEHKVVYCQIPKVGTSNWLKIFAVLESKMNKTSDLGSNKIHDVALPMVSYLNRTTRDYAMKHYTKFLVAREPFDRALSAYRDKFIPKEGYGRPMFAKLGKALIDRYRNDSENPTRSNPFPSFSEYVKYLTDPKNSEVPTHYSEPRHWQPQSDLCYPCNINYDYILRIENIEEESDYILRKVGAPAGVRYPEQKTKTSEEIKKDMMRVNYSQVPPADVNALFHYYGLDYQLFGYDPPPQF